MGGVRRFCGWLIPMARELRGEGRASQALRSRTRPGAGPAATPPAAHRETTGDAPEAGTSAQRWNLRPEAGRPRST